MALADDLSKLDELHQRGSLSDTEFAQAKARLLQGGASAEPAVPLAVNGLRRSTSDRWLGGVCGGLAVFSGMDSWIWRMLFVLTLLMGGVGLLIYGLMWLLVPLDPELPRLPKPAEH